MLADAPRAWSDADASDVGRVARRIAARRRERERASARDAHADGFVGVVEDALGCALVDGEPLARWVMDAGAREVEARRTAAAALDARSRTFDGWMYLAAARREASARALREEADGARRASERAVEGRRMRVVECLPMYLACLDAVEDARETLRRGREERDGEFGATSELATRCERAARCARETLRGVFELNERRQKITRALEALERRSDVFGVPGKIREALARSDYAEAAELRGRALASFSGSPSRVLSAVLEEIDRDVASAAERLYERLYVGTLDDDEAEKTVTAIQTLGVSTAETDVGDAPILYLDRLVEVGCAEMTTLASADEWDDEALGRLYRAHFMRAWRFATLTDASASTRGSALLDKLQLVYVGLVKARFDNFLSKQRAASTDLRTSSRFRAVMEKCEYIARVGLSLLRTYDVLHARLELKPCVFEITQQQHARISVILRVQLELALKMAAQRNAGDDKLSHAQVFLRRDARLIFDTAAGYWRNSALSAKIVEESARDVNALVDAFHVAASAVLARPSETSRDLNELLSSMRLNAALRVEYGALQKAIAIDLRQNGSASTFEDELTSALSHFNSRFIEGNLDILRTLSRQWFASSVDTSASVSSVRKECLSVVSALATNRAAACAFCPQVEPELFQTIVHGLVDYLRREFTSNLATLQPSMRQIRLEFEFMKLALEPLCTKTARESATRLVDLASRVCGSADDALARASALQRELSAHVDLLSTLRN